MKKHHHFKSLKRLNILNKPTRVADIRSLQTEKYEDQWLIQADKIQTKRLRRFRQQLAS
ncbi:hypothetical protein KBD11_01470 [Candidatus Saccharibacteria bacterium]|nr:hypothetical protein [Candidatus Saccharibacteria bacterium]